MALPVILCVDDEPHVLEGLTRILRKKFDVRKASSGDAALSLLDAGETFEVVVSDMRMPGMTGAALLARFRERAPDTTRLLLTGYADIDSAMAAVNDGHVFRFLTKPCPPEVLVPAFEAASAQHRLVTSERVLLEQTLLGSVRALTEALALAHPEAFRDAARTHERARAIADQLGMPDAWHVEVASMLSQVGYVVLPSDVVAKLQVAAPLDVAEREMVSRLPELAERVLSHIPRLEKVREVLRRSSSHDPTGRRASRDIPTGAAILDIVADLAAAEAKEGDTASAIAALQANAASYDPAVLHAMAVACAPAPPELRSCRVGDLRTGMVLAADVRALSGIMLVARGQRVTVALIERLRNVATRVGVVEPIVCEVRH